MGRNAAGESFLKGYIKYSTASTFWAHVQSPEHTQQFSKTIISLGRTEPLHTVYKSNYGQLSQPGLMYFPGPNIGTHAFHRSAFGHESWSLCGITHTTSSSGAMDAIVDLLTTPVQSWDSLICTSSTVKDNVTRLLQAQAEYLKDRLGVTKLTLPMMPVIPLGIHTAEFDFSSITKSAARFNLGIDNNTLVVLYMGRLSFHAKAHPLVMYQGLEMAAKLTDKKVVLVECGWHANEFIEKAYEDAAEAICPSIRVVRLDGRNPNERTTAWSSADIFCSLSDNIQETFGITPIEAMASGLPVVVSDWDGYKETIREGIDGFRIPTFMPQTGLGIDLALRYALDIDSYDMYCGQTSTLVAVDLEATSQAFVKLFNSSELRLKMGENGRKRAKEVFDWKSIIPMYEDLWSKQSELRFSKGNKLKNTHPSWPARMDPFNSFASYPTNTFTPETLLSLVDSQKETMEFVYKVLQLKMVNYSYDVLPSAEEIKIIICSASETPKKAINLLVNIESHRKAFVLRGLVWLIKLGVFKVS
jgi:glycosyltransferase involved in cell wall biosynthesis